MMIRKMLMLFLLGAFQGLSAQESNLSNGLFFDGEPYLAVHPDNPRNIIVAWMGFVPGQNITIKVRSSLDGGQSWSPVKLMPHFGGSGWKSADPSLAFDKSGDVYLCYIDYRQLPDSGGIYVARSTDGGMNWNSPQKAFDAYENGDKPIDRPWLVIDRSVSNGNFYISSKPAPWDPTPNRPYFKYSTDKAGTWSQIKTVDSADYPASLIAAPMAAPAVGADGKLHLAYPSWKGGFNLPRFVLASSANGGQSLSRTEIFSTAQGNNGDTISKLAYCLLANPTDANNLFFVYPDRSQGDIDVLGRYSLNGGNTWSAPIRLNDDSTANQRDQDMIWGAFAANGDLVLAWRDRRKASGSGYAQDYDIYAAVSKNKGQSFGKNIRLNQNTAPYNNVLEQNGNDFLGAGLAADTIYCAWGDVRTGKLNIFFSRTSVNTGSGTGIRLGEELLPLRLYPNPAGHFVMLPELPVTAADTELRLWDAQGRAQKVLLQNKRLDISGLPSGHYWLEIKGSTFHAQGHFVKN